MTLKCSLRPVGRSSSTFIIQYVYCWMDSRTSAFGRSLWWRMHLQYVRLRSCSVQGIDFSPNLLHNYKIVNSLTCWSQQANEFEQQIKLAMLCSPEPEAFYLMIQSIPLVDLSKLMNLNNRIKLVMVCERDCLFVLSQWNLSKMLQKRNIEIACHKMNLEWPEGTSVLQ